MWQCSNVEINKETKWFKLTLFEMTGDKDFCWHGQADDKLPEQTEISTLGRVR